MNSKITLAVVGDQILMRKGIIALLKDYEYIEVIIEASNGNELIEKLDINQPKVVLLDFEMPLIDESETIEILKDRYPDIKIVILTSHHEESILIELMEKGANGFIQKNDDIDVIVSAINSVLSDNYYFDKHVLATVAKKLVETNKSSSSINNSNILSAKEIEVIRLICEEHSNKEIAEKLFLSHRTIDSYREKIMHKIGAKNTAGIVVYAFKNDLIKK